MMRADSGFRAQSFQSQRFFVMFVDRVADLSHQFDLRIVGARAVRMTTPAGAKSGLLGRFRNLEKADLLASRAARRARRAAVDSRRADGENKAAVARGIARQDGVPEFRIVHHD